MGGQPLQQRTSRVISQAARSTTLLTGILLHGDSFFSYYRVYAFAAYHYRLPHARIP